MKTANKEIYLTKKGYTDIQNQILELKKQRLQITEIVEETRITRDDSDFLVAQQNLTEINIKITALEETIEKAKILEEKIGDTVQLGNTINIKFIEDNEEESFQIVSSIEADSFNQKISDESPIAKAVIGKQLGDIVNVELPNGNNQIEIIKIT